MPTTRQELDMELDRLQDTLPALESDEEATFDYLDFQQKAQAVVDAAFEDDRDYFQSRVTCMLASAGLVPSESEGEPCPALPDRKKIDDALRKLEASIPQLQRDYGDDFLVAFAGEADVIEDNAGPHAAYVASRLQRMLPHVDQ